MGEKKLLTIEELESQTALELPERETLDTIVLNCVAVCVGQIRFRDVNIQANACVQVGAAVTAVVQALTVLSSALGVTGTPEIECRVIGGGQGG